MPPTKWFLIPMLRLAFLEQFRSFITREILGKLVPSYIQSKYKHTRVIPIPIHSTPERSTPSIPSRGTCSDKMLTDEIIEEFPSRWSSQHLDLTAHNSDQMATDQPAHEVSTLGRSLGISLFSAAESCFVIYSEIVEKSIIVRTAKEKETTA